MNKPQQNPLYLSLVSLILAAIIPFASSLFFDFTYDDHSQITDNPVVKSSANLFEAFSSASTPGNIYRPLTVFSFMITSRLFGNDALPFHATNLLIHAAVSVLLFLLLRSLFGEMLAFSVAIIFAVHPIHTEVIANIWNRSEALAALFGLLSLIFVRASTQVKECRKIVLQLGLGSVFLFLALCSKESAFVFILLEAALLYSVHRRNFTIFYVISALIGVALPAIAYCLLRIGAGAPFGAVAINYMDNITLVMPSAQRAMEAVGYLGRYIAICFLPVSLHADYSFAQIVPTSDFLNVTYLSYVGALTILVWIAFQRGTASFFAQWFVLAFAITSNFLMPIGVAFAERLAYLPSIGICGLLAIAINRVPARFSKILLCAVTLIFAVISQQYSQRWHDDFTLWSTELRDNPQSVRVHHLLANEYYYRKEYKEAVEQEQIATSIFPRFIPGFMRAQRAYAKMGDIKNSEHLLAKARELEPTYSPAYDASGWNQIVLKNYNRAEQFFDDALQRDSQNRSAVLGKFALARLKRDFKSADLFESQLTPEDRRDPRYTEYNKN